MKRRATFARRLAIGLCGLGGLWLAHPAHAQSASAQGSSAAPAAAAPAVATWSSANLPGVNVYQDKYISGGTLAPDVSTNDAQTSDTEGLARSLQVDAVVSALGSSAGGPSDNVSESGLIVRSQWETASYGAWSFDGSVRTGESNLGPYEQGQGGTLSLRQRGMPFDGDWQADNALGDINTPDIGLARQQPRFFLPTTPMQGLTTEWRGPENLQIVAGGGEPGQFDGIEVPDFRTLSGSTATLGAQWSPAAHWTVGGQFIDAHDVNMQIGPIIDTPAMISSATGLVSAVWADNGERLQLNVLDGSSGGKSNSIGTWVDGSITQGRIQQGAGLFYIDPNLTWGNQLISSDMEGGYYRLSYQSRQWVADAGIDEVRSISGLGSDTTYLTGDARYQISRDWGIGGLTNLSRTNADNSWSLGGYLDHVNGLGTSRWQADFISTPNGQDTSLSLNQAWATPVGMRLSTSAYLERINGALINGLVQDSTVLGLAAYGGGQFTSRLGIDGNVQWAHALQGEAAPGVSANISLTYQLSPNWKILATYYESQTGSWTPLTVVSPIGPPLPVAVPAINQRGFFLTLRYQRASGSHFAPMGGAPGTGAGEITGLVYLDANNNGQFEAGEAGAPNVTVVLDGRYSTQTDSSGRFSFPAVANGHHVITVVADNLPLPWFLAGDGRTTVEVSTRERSFVAIGAQRPR